MLICMRNCLFNFSKAEDLRSNHEPTSHGLRVTGKKAGMRRNSRAKMDICEFGLLRNE